MLPVRRGSCKDLLNEDHPSVARRAPYVNPHLPVLGKTTKGTYIDHNGDEVTVFAPPNDRPPTSRTTASLKRPSRENMDIAASCLLKEVQRTKGQRW